MRKRMALLVLTAFLTLGSATPSLAKTESVSSLKKQISKLQSENKKLKSEVSTLKKKVPTVIAGNIYKDGVSAGSSQFVTMAGKDYVEIGSIVPLLTVYDETDFVFNRSLKSLYLGLTPRNGMIDLTRLSPYEEYNYSDLYYLAYDMGSRGIQINGKRYTTGITGRYSNWFASSQSGSVGVQYKLDGKYTALKFKYGMDDNSSASGSLSVYGDGNLLFDSGNIERLEDAKEAQVDIQGVKFLEISINMSPKAQESYPVLAEPVLLP
ncbi:NPCBM/NEW2 domain-containing protein [Peribacillus glennii]|uniref:Glycosyl hydrolase family 98 putative carbohydrate-binding module domain-containing protein n=1 Tax=Peribacillus glennii TaxID=2303991 RepID=A0A372L7U1_9BACI|nr:NPCBM/NEW2 domain-containing protein [Peribacillus glennii]RFU60781.1 hypothetical protein D0466_20745 [Peribacillus glennii]